VNPSEPLRTSVNAAYPAQDFWSRLIDRAYSIWFRLPARGRSGVTLARQFVPGCLQRNIPVARLRGPARPSGQEAVLLVAGAEPWVDYLPRRFFAEPPKRESIGRASIWSLPGLLRRLRSSADLTIARVDRLSKRMFFGGDYLHVPEWIGADLAIPENLPALFRSNTSLHGDMRRMRRQRLQPSISHLMADFDLFYDTMYAPYARARYEDLSMIGPKHRWRHWFRRGGVLFVERDGERLAGLLFTRYKDTFYFSIVGTRDGQWAPVKQGALAALKFFAIQHAQDMGCNRIGYGNSRSVLQDGVLRFKSKWRVRFYPNPFPLFELMVYWNRLEGVVADFFSHTSLIFMENGGLAAIHATAGDRPPEPADYKALWINGLSRLFLVGRGAWPSGMEESPRITFLNPGTRPGYFSN